MTKKPRTKDEHFILCLYQKALTLGDIHAPFDRYEIGSLAHMHPRGVDAISHQLLRANFIKKSGEIDIYLTDQGQQLALRLLEE